MKLRTKIAMVGGGILIGALCVCGAGEFYLRRLHPMSYRIQGQSIILPVHQRYEYWNAHLSGCDEHILHTKNSLGFRGEEPPADFDRVLSLVAVGGSTTECFYLSDGKDWPDLLGRKLSSRFDPVWINNAGLDGHSTYGHLILLQDYVLKLHPKVILFLVGINDEARSSLNANDAGLLKEAHRVRSLFFAIQKHSRLLTALQNARLAYLARVHGLGHKPGDLRQTPVLEIPEATRRRALEEHQNFQNPYAHRLEQLVDLCQKNGIVPVLITQPCLCGKAIDDITNVDLAKIQAAAPGQNGLLAWDILELYNQTTRRVAQERNVCLIDLAHLMPKSSRYFYDFYHFTNAGAERVASCLAQGLGSTLARRFPEFIKG